MVAIEEDLKCPQQTTQRRNSKDDGKACYSVNIRINKSPRVSAKPASDVCQQEESSCFPVLPPPIKNIPDCVCFNGRKGAKDAGHSGKRSAREQTEVRKTRENYCQTDTCHRQHQACDPIEVPLKSSCETGTQCRGITSLTSDSYCQTVLKEMKHFGLQTPILERNARYCQTDLEQHCDAVGVSHDRNSCRKPCCLKEGHQTRDAHQNYLASGAEPLCQVSPYKGGACKCCHKARASCESKQSAFPFIGRTPSGNFKVSPSMVSFVNTEFGILAANPQSARITVRKLQSCESTLVTKGLERCPQQVPANRRNVCGRKPCCMLKQFCTRQQQDPTVSHLTPLQRTSSDEGYKTPRGISPPRYNPHHMEAAFPGRHDTDKRHQPNRHQPDNYINHYYKDYLDTVELQPALQMSTPPPPPIYQCHLDHPVSNRAPIPQNETDHADNWKYVNPKYKRYDPRRFERLDHNHDPYQHHSREPRHSGDEADYQAPVFDHMNGNRRNSDQYCRPGRTGLEGFKDLGDTAKWNPFLEEHLDTGLTKYKQANDIKNTVDKYYQDFADVGAKPRPDDKRDIQEVGGDQPFIPNTAPVVENNRDQDPKDDLYDDYQVDPDHPDLTDHRYVPDSDQLDKDHHDPYHFLEEYEDGHEPDTHPGSENKHPKDKQHDKHQHHHHHHVHNDNDDIGHHHHVYNDNDYIGHHHHHHHEHRDHPHHTKNDEELNKELRRSLEKDNDPEKPSDKDNPTSDTPEQLPLKPRDTIFRLVEPDSNYQLLTTSDPDEAATSPTELMPKDEFQNGPDSKKKRSSGYLGPEDETPASVLPNLDTVKGVVILFGGANPKLPYGPGNGGRSVYMFTRETNKWRRIGLLPSPRTNFGLARVGNQVYIIGGTDPQSKDEDGRNNPVTTVFRLDLRSGEWDTLKKLDLPRSHFGCVAIGQFIYIIGGNVDKRASRSCIKYDIAKNEFRSIAPLGIERSNMGIAVYGTGVMIAGGATKNPERLILETVICYEPVKDRWTPWANLPSPRAFCSLVVSKNRVYLIAGAGMRNIKKKGNHSLPDVLCYNEGKDEWEEVGMISTPRHGHTAVVLAENIIIIGGVSSHTMGALDSVEIFSPSDGMTSIVKSISQNKSGMVALAL